MENEMDYKLIIYAEVSCADGEVIGTKEAIAEALDIMGCDVTRIDVEEDEEC